MGTSQGTAYKWGEENGKRDSCVDLSPSLPPSLSTTHSLPSALSLFVCVFVCADAPIEFPHGNSVAYQNPFKPGTQNYAAFEAGDAAGLAEYNAKHS